jgi:hypothetical protein
VGSLIVTQAGECDQPKHSGFVGRSGLRSQPFEKKRPKCSREKPAWYRTNESEGSPLGSSHQLSARQWLALPVIQGCRRGGSIRGTEQDVVIGLGKGSNQSGSARGGAMGVGRNALFPHHVCPLVGGGTCWGSSFLATWVRP